MTSQPGGPVAAQGRRIVSIGAIAVVASSLLQWWQIGGGPGELPLRAGAGISDGPVFLMFLAATASLLLIAFRLASERPVPIDHPYAYLGLLAVALLGYVVRLAGLAGQGLAPWPPPRGAGVWLAAAGLALLAVGVLKLFRERLPEAEDYEAAHYEAPVPTPAPDSAAHEAPDEVPDETPPSQTESAEGQDSAPQPKYVPRPVMTLWHRLARPSDHPDRSAALDSEPRGRLDRMDIWVVLALVIVILSMRVYRLGEPTQMYFDEVYHARTATEFLQDWRYDIPHDIFEWTHPHLAKYAIAGGITLFSDDKVTSTGQLGISIKDAVIQQRTANSPGSSAPVDPNAETNYDTDYGDRVLVATGSEVRAYDLGTRALTHTYSIPGASALSSPDVKGLVYVGTSDGKLYSIDTNSLDDLRAGSTTTVKPAVELAATTGISIAHVFAGNPPYILVSDASGTVVSIDLTVGGGTIVGRGVIPGAVDFASLGAGSGSTPEVLVAYRDGVGLLDARNVLIKSTIPTDSPATSIALNPDALRAHIYRFYVTAGDSLLLLRMDTTSTPAAVSREGDQPLARMPGEVTRVVFDDATKIAQVLGRTSDGTSWTVYAVETNGNAVFSDARLPFEPVAIGIDNAVQVRGLDRVTQMPSVDREALLAFASDGSTASVDVGQFAFSWRIVGVFFGTLMAVCLYLLARILFRRRSVGLLVAAFSLVDGMLFAQSRIAMNDTYVGGLMLLAYLIFAVVWLRVWQNRFVFWLGMPLLGVVLGLALVSKWVAFYAIASIGVLILIRSALGRLVTVLGLGVGTGILGWMALAEMRYQPDTGNVPLTLMCLTGAVVVLGVGLALAARTRLVPDKVFVGVATAVLAGLLLAGALLASPGSVDNGAPNYTFFVIMLAVTCMAA
ncbi:MAG TPA: phospholipid carrier-dependent glycosyltransferase, partial [Candidatus Limnocylindrales bacterium]